MNKKKKDPVFCVNCKYFSHAGHGYDTWVGWCTFKKELNLVSGEIMTNCLSAMKARIDSNLCGPSGKWFEPKEEI